MSLYEKCIGQYSIQKTLRSELRPVGKTAENFEKKGLLKDDEKKDRYYNEVKKIINEYHKRYIEEKLSNVSKEGVDEFRKLLGKFYGLYVKKDKTSDEQDKQKKAMDLLRQQIYNFLKPPKEMFKKELIKDYLMEFVAGDEEKEGYVKEFDKFTTYFRGFNDNRQNIYSVDENAGAIPYRLINENLPIYIDNIRIFETMKDKIDKKDFKALENSVKDLLNGRSLSKVFDINGYNDFLTQKGIDLYREIIWPLNMFINEYNQKRAKNERLGKFKRLYKQILSDRTTISFVPDFFDGDQELLDTVKKFGEKIEPLLEKAERLLNSIEDYDTSRIYVKNDASLRTISSRIYKDHAAIIIKTEERYDKDYKGKHKYGTDKYIKEKEQYLKNIESYSLDEINTLMGGKIVEYFINSNNRNEEKNIFQREEAAWKDFLILTEKEYPQDKSLAASKSDVKKIKAYLDALKDIHHFIDPLMGSRTEPDKEERFYGEFAEVHDGLSEMVPLYNKARNYCTKKPFSTEKIKLNFENSTLLAGWDLSKEADNTSVIFIKDNKYYLGIMDKRHSRIFDDLSFDSKELDKKCYKKMEYKFLPGPNKMLPKVFFSKKGTEQYEVSEEIQRIYKSGTFKKGNDFNLEDCHKLIDFYKKAIGQNEDWSVFGFSFSETEDYKDISDFYREVELQGYNLRFKDIPENIINKMVDEGQLYLFQIYNKDFSPKSKGKPNLHTLYWKMIFAEENLKEYVFKLNGEAEIFYRKKSITDDAAVVHHAGEELTCRHSEEKKVFDHDIIKDKRYTEDKFLFHVPITINFKATGTPNINSLINKAIKDSDDIHIIGIDRGERHLVYVSVIDQHGGIIEQYSLNEILNEYQGKHYRTNYQKLLDEKGESMLKARRDWDVIASIKELKAGYLSQVIHKITELMIQYDAVVVIEDLNMGFIRGRQKIDKQIYQKFEKMLIEKLNYLVIDKEDIHRKAGGVMTGYQLTNKFKGFKYLGKQSGVLLHIPAWNTSKIDPQTGFVNLIRPKYESIKQAREFIAKIDKIRYNGEEKYFEFDIDYDNFTDKAKGTKTQWTICTYGDRIDNLGNKIDITSGFVSLLQEHDIELAQGDLKHSFLEVDRKEFYEKFMYLLRLTLQMRNSIARSSRDEDDYLISPVKGPKGSFFDSRNTDNLQKGLPINADANGAYNIALKGLWAVEQIRETRDEKIAKPNITIRNKEWLKYVQSRNWK